ncbi:BRO1-domain-containing protein [Ceraceosorus guamensis]|uniref:BRO1-domain-containing protein n=1 Tax=Ceraceosorus guamensis TaxID=1522189 RepID=A0A316W5E0_9BASI|nr:BRO1-domain-containing protein [Ceraceosorus guamensis]PWN45049.1 BRO1-domain-containing protein [Ceraceosorus guamensis]
MPANLLSLPSKSSQLATSQLTSSLKEYITSRFPDVHPSAFKRDLESLQRIRDDAVSLDGHASGLLGGAKYHAQLVWLGTKTGADVQIPFSWIVALPSNGPPTSISPPSSPSTSRDQTNLIKASLTTSSSGQTIAVHPSISYERCALLWSLAALHSSLAAREGRGDNESIKRAISGFSIAAGILNALLSLVTELLSEDIARTSRAADLDLAPRNLAALRDLMLAQAQECAWSRAVRDRLKDGTIARLALRVQEFYSSALAHAQGSCKSPIADLPATSSARPEAVTALELLPASLPKDWVAHITAKQAHFSGAAQYRKSVEDGGANRYGTEIARLQLAQQHIKQALDACRSKGVSTMLAEDARSLQAVIGTNLHRAVKDNDLIYLEAIPSAGDLPKILGASLVEAKVPSELEKPLQHLSEGTNVTPALGKPLFAELVPYAVHVAVSVYEDRKDSYVRDELNARREELDAIAASTLQSLSLPGSLQALEQPQGLPSSLLRKSDEVRLSGGLDRLRSISDDIQRIASVDERLLAEIFEHLESEEREDRELREDFDQVTREGIRMSSDVAGAEMRNRAVERWNIFQGARSSDAIVQKKIEDWEDIIDVLASGEASLSAFLPSANISSSSALQSSAHETSVRSLRKALEELDDVQDARATSIAEARARAKEDDIRPDIIKEAAALVGGSNGSQRLAWSSNTNIQPAAFEPIFEQRLERYHKYVKELEAGATVQEQLLDRIAKANEAFIAARRTDAQIKRREGALQNLDLGFAKYKEITSNLEEGLRFYNDLARILSELKQEVKEWHRARQMDIAHLISRFQGTSLSPSTNTTPQRVQTRSQAAFNQSAPHPPAPSRGGAWTGGTIKFDD